MSTSVNKGGRPSKYTPKFCTELIKFFSGPKFTRVLKSEKITTKKDGKQDIWREYMYMPNDLPTFAKFARKIKVSGETIVIWAKKKNELKYPGFFTAYNDAKELQKEFLSDNALKSLHPPATFIFIAKNITDWKDKNETEHSGNLTWTEQPPK